MLCDLCFRMLRGQEGRIWKGTYDLNFKHHTEGEKLLKSSEMNCGICRVLYNELKPKLDSTVPFLDQELLVTASLSVLDHPRTKDLYRLDFTMRCNRTRARRTFVLKKAEDSSDPSFRTPISSHTSSDEVYHLARQWISRCKCTPNKLPSWFPGRLISLEELKTKDYLDTKRLISTGQQEPGVIENTYVKLVETIDWEDGQPNKGNVRYCTLSHCWGTQEMGQQKLDSKNIDEYKKKGIKLSELPKTFRDAIEFASRLPRVGFIWIDSLCIKQGPQEMDDWLIQSACMDQVYSESFLNISATASSNSNEGLFFTRQPELLLEDEVILNIDGIPGVNKEERLVKRAHNLSTPKSQPSRFRWLQDFVAYLFKLLRPFRTFPRSVDGLDLEIPPSMRRRLHSRDRLRSDDVISIRDVSPPRVRNETSERSNFKNLRRCILLDVSHWTENVDNAPVNRRGWVLQERLMAPRVLHFCKDQIAWECSEFDASEGQPQGIPNLQLTSDGIVGESRLKGLDVTIDGKRLRQIRLETLGGLNDPDKNLRPQIYALELWRRIVEVYSKTSITRPEDKLVALSGMARLMARKIGTPDNSPDQYVAGLWRTHLESQLLWKVEPVFREIDEVFDHVSTAPHPDKYRAPSFSWAAIDAEKGNGITYAEVTNQDLFIKIDQVSITPKTQDNKYGMITAGHIYIWGKLRKATLIQKPKGRFGWNLNGRGELDNEEHTNVYLDCLARDSDSIFGRDADIYVLPAAQGERTASLESKYVICLILQLVRGRDIEGFSGGEHAFRRIGLTKLSPWADHLTAHGILEPFESDIGMPHQDYDSKTGMHRILII